MTATSRINHPTKRLLNIRESATYCGVGISRFKAHCDVRPVKLGTTILYDRLALDLWIDQLSGLNQTMRSGPDLVDEAFGDEDLP